MKKTIIIFKIYIIKIKFNHHHDNQTYKKIKIKFQIAPQKNKIIKNKYYIRIKMILLRNKIYRIYIKTKINNYQNIYNVKYNQKLIFFMIIYHINH